MLKQTNKNLLPIIQKVGCYFNDLIFIVNPKVEDADSINQLWKNCKEVKYIDNKNNLANPDGILKQAFFMFGGNRVIQIGARADGKTIFWDWVKNKKVDYICRCYQTLGTEGIHWVLFDGFGTKLYDPYDKPYTRVKIIKEILYQITG